MTNDKMRAEFEAWWQGGNNPDAGWANETDLALTAWQAATRRALPDGFVPVPVEPTEDMLTAARNAECRVFGSLEMHNAAIYAAMLQAAPKVGENGNADL